MNPVRRRRIVGKAYPMLAAKFVAANSQFASITDASLVGLDPGTSDFAIAFWVNPGSLAALRTVIGKGATSDTAGGAPGYWIFLNTTGTLGLRFCDNANSTRISYTSAGTAPVLTWTHIVINFTRAANVQAFINGAAQGVTDISTRAGTLTNSADFTLGGLSANGVPPSGSSGMDGSVDMAAFWLRVLTQAEITQLYNGGSGLNYRDLSGGLRSGLSAWYDCDGNLSDAGMVNSLTPGAGTQAPSFGPGKR